MIQFEKIKAIGSISRQKVWIGEVMMEAAMGGDVGKWSMASCCSAIQTACFLLTSGAA